MKRKKKKGLEKTFKLVRTTAQIGIGVEIFRKKVLPWILVAGAIAAAVLLDVAIPEEKSNVKYKEIW